MKSILLLTITLQVVLCRPDVSHLSGSLGPGKGYDYPPPGGAHTGDRAVPDVHDPASHDHDLNEHNLHEHDLIEHDPVDEDTDNVQFDPNSLIFKPDQKPTGTGPGGIPDVLAGILPPLPSIFTGFGPPPPPPSPVKLPTKPDSANSIQSSISTGSFSPAGAGTGAVAATYVAGNPGVTHNAQLKGHVDSQKFINLFTRD